MSSRVILPGDPREATPVVWREVGPGGSVAAPAAASIAPAGVDSSTRIAQMERQMEQRLQEAHAAGVREGEAAGRNRAAAELQQAVDRMAHSIQEMAGLRHQFRRDAEADLIRLAMAIARRVIRRELAVDPDALHGLILGALEKLQSQEISRVRTHPSHAALITSSLSQTGVANRVEVIADPSRQPGSVLFETTRGDLDASVDGQLEEIERGLTDRLRKQS